MEFTLQSDEDFYNLSVIDGFNLPVEIKPTGGSASKPGDPDYSTWCVNAGAVTNPSSGFGNCDWMPKIKEQYLFAVTSIPGGGGAKSCTKNGDCDSSKGEVCGVGMLDRKKLVCGKHTGFWPGRSFCEFQGTCQTNVPGSSNTYFDLLACAGSMANSPCHPPGNPTDPNCCGCPDWDTLGIKIPAKTHKCPNTNARWTQYALPGLQWMKEMCPTSYTYPYDDKTSLSICGSGAGKPNSVEYTVTFCPGGTKALGFSQ